MSCTVDTSFSTRTDPLIWTNNYFSPAFGAAVASTTFAQDSLSRAVVLNPKCAYLSRRGYWETSEENLERLRQLYTDVEDKIEGVV